MESGGLGLENLGSAELWLGGRVRKVGVEGWSGGCWGQRNRGRRGVEVGGLGSGELK